MASSGSLPKTLQTSRPKMSGRSCIQFPPVNTQQKLSSTWSALIWVLRSRSPCSPKQTANTRIEHDTQTWLKHITQCCGDQMDVWRQWHLPIRRAVIYLPDNQNGIKLQREEDRSVKMIQVAKFCGTVLNSNELSMFCIPKGNSRVRFYDRWKVSYANDSLIKIMMHQ